LVFGQPASPAVIKNRLDRVTYDSRSRQVRLVLRDGAECDYLLPIPNRRGYRQSVTPEPSNGRVARISGLMALAIKFENMIRDGAARDYAEIADVGHISRARMSQIVGLLNLAPTIQETLLFFPKVLRGCERLTERQMRGITEVVDWQQQVRLFRAAIAVGQV
jgi:hypothetical protein